MEIKIDESVMSEELQKQTSEAIRGAFGQYDVKRALEEAISKQVLPQLISDAILTATDKIDTATLQNAVAREITKSVTKGVQMVIRESMVDLMVRLSGIPDYDRDGLKAKRAEIETKFDKERDK